MEAGNSNKDDQPKPVSTDALKDVVKPPEVLPPRIDDPSKPNPDKPGP